MFVFLSGSAAWAASPLRVFIRGGVKTHGPNQHDHPRFLGEWTKFLGERGMQVSGGMEFPTAPQLAATDVVIIYAADGMRITGADRTNFEAFLARGGGVVVLHDGVVAGDQNEWCKTIIGGTWIWEKSAPGHTQTKWHEGEVGLFFVDTEHPITKGISNFDWKDEVYNQLEMSPDVHVLAQSFIDVFNIWPQLWTYERTMAGGAAPYRAFVSIPGHEYDVFQTPHYRALLLRGIAWAGKRPNADEFCQPVELASLTYPAGGPRKPADAKAEMKLHPEFNVNLVADETVAEKIMSLDWDPQGRLWVVETPEYPGGRDVNKNDFKAYWNRLQDPKKYPVGGKMDRAPRDRISILTDTDGDGIMDRKTVFADGLELPTSLVFYKDGVIVSQAPDILWIRDTNGDGKADKVEVLYTGWGTFDTHAVINNLKWGMDGWIYGTVGYTKGDVKSGDGTRSFGKINDGAYRFRPDGSALEQVSANGCNTWGLDITPDNEVIYTTATCGNPILHVVLPEKYLARGSIGGHPAWENVIDSNVIYPPFKETRQPYVQIDWVNQWTAAAGATVYDGGAWPAKWGPEERYSFFMSEATMHLFHHEFLDWNGATLKGRREEGRKETEFFTGGNDYWFRPIHARVGPDGAMYVVDFYNQIAVHNDTRGPAHGARNAAARPDRDHHFTRLWRVQHKEARTLPAFRLDAKNPAGLVEMLSHPNGWVRGTANRLLTENPEALNGVRRELDQAVTNPRGSVFGRIQALWLTTILAENYRLEQSAPVPKGWFSEGSAALRKTAFQVLAEFASRPELRRNLRSESGVDIDDGMELAVLGGLRDPDARVRLHALRAAGDLVATPRLAAALTDAWPQWQGRWLQSAAVGAASKDPLRHLEAVFRTPDPVQSLAYAQHLVRVVGNRNESTLTAKLLVLLARQPQKFEGLQIALLETLSTQLPVNGVIWWDPPTTDALKSFMLNPRTANVALGFCGRGSVVEMLGSSVKPAVTRAIDQLSDPATPVALRGQLAQSLMGVRNADVRVVPALSALLGRRDTPEDLQKRLVSALGGTAEGAVELVKVFPRLPSTLIEPAFAMVLKRKDAVTTFLSRLADRSIPLTVLGPGRLHRLRTFADPTVAARAAEVINALTGGETRSKDALISRFRPEVVKPGDPTQGKAVFLANCAGCHQYKNDGRNLAPNLNGMGAHGPEDLLVHILDPNRVVEANFLSQLIETSDGTTYNGIIARENTSEVVLRDATADHTVRVSEIKQRSATGISLMPEGFEGLGAESLRNLLAYLCVDDARFRVLDLSRASTRNTARDLFAAPENEGEFLMFKRHGLQRVEEVPFNVVSPAQATANVIVLKGGPGDVSSRKTLPRKVEVPVGVAARRLHFLGGIAGWGFPFVQDKQLPVLKVTVLFVGGAREEMVFKNGVEFADWLGRHDVPGSKWVDWTVGPGQVRWFSRDIQGRGVVDKLILESYDNEVAPTVVASSSWVRRPAGRICVRTI